MSSRVSSLLSSNGEVSNGSVRSMPSIGPLRNHLDSLENPIHTSSVRPTEKQKGNVSVSPNDSKKKEREHDWNRRGPSTTKPNSWFPSSTHLRSVGSQFSTPPANPVETHPKVSAATLTHFEEPVSTTEKEDVSFVSQGTYVFCSSRIVDSFAFTTFRSSSRNGPGNRIDLMSS